MIEAHGVIKNYGKVRALNNFELSVKKNTIHALVGPNGSGKSTLIKILSTEIKPDSGDITIDDIPITNVKEIKEMVSVIAGISSLPERNTTKNLLIGAAKSNRISGEEMSYRIEVLSDMLGLEDDLDRKIGELSRGMKRRVTFGMSLIKDPDVLLIDGALAELDPGFSIKFLNTIKALGDKTILLTANNMNLIDRYCDGVAIINNGTTLLNETMLSIRQKISRPAVTFKVSPINRTKLETALRQQIFVNKTVSMDDSVLVEVDDILHIPSVIRQAATFTEIYEVRQTMSSLEDLYHTFIEPK